jgi:hypothetical protein
MLRNLGLAITTALICTYSTGASAAESAFADASSTEAAVAVSDSTTYGVAAEADNSVADSVAAASLAATATEGSGSDWEFEVTPYLWASGMKADIKTPQGEEAHVDDSFFDILGDLKFALMSTFEARHGRFVTAHDLFYISLGSSADGRIGPIPVDADVDEKLLLTTHLVGYRVVDQGPMSLDLMAGARVVSLKVDVKLSGPLQEIKRENSGTKVGPMIASRFRTPLGGKWAASLYGDVGGFGVNDFNSWQLWGTIQYEISDRWRLATGWRHFSVRKDKNDFEAHVKLDGPTFGATYSF